MSIRLEIEGDLENLIDATLLAASRRVCGRRMQDIVKRRAVTKTQTDGTPWATKTRGRAIAARGMNSTLAQSITLTEESDGATIRSTHPAIVWIVDGTKPHTIRPRTKKALFWQGASHPVAKVEHPGTPPFDFLSVDDTDADELTELAADVLFGRS